MQSSDRGDLASGQIDAHKYAFGVISPVLDIGVGIVKNAKNECIFSLVTNAGVVLVTEFDSLEFKVAATLTLSYVISIWATI